MDLLDFARGPALQAAIGIFVFGTVWRIVSLFLIHHGWRAALLSVFFIALAQLFRYIANDVDRIGWSIDRDRESGVGDATRRYQRSMLYLSFGLTQAQHLALIVQAGVVAGPAPALAMLATLVFIEVLYARIDERRFRLVIYALLLLAGVALIARGISS